MPSPDSRSLEALKQQAIVDFSRHVSSAKACFWQQLEMDVVMGRREGPFFWDLDGKKRYWNLHCNGGVYNLGHRHPQIIRELELALRDLDMGNGHLISKARADLGRRLAELMPGDLDYVVFGVSGGEAVDLSIKVARAFTGRAGIISALGGYHGHTGLALAAGDRKYREPFGPSCPGFRQVPFNDINAMEAAVDVETAAVILETVPATLGIPVPSTDYFSAVGRICHERGALLIMDEVQTGFGRTGKLWGFEHFDVLPDMVVLAKGMSGGIYPITATVLRKPLESVFHADPHIHVSTGGGSELGCRVALKVLELSSAPDFLDHVNRLSEYFRTGIEKLAGRYEVLRGLRQLGLFMGLEMADEFCGQLMCKAAFDNGLFMVYANNRKSVVQFLPPLIITVDQADEIMEGLDRALKLTGELRDFFGPAGGSHEA
ncbi:MAG: aminotransferase class III-fold pyridoxal phosphate-dependent enzyme [Thermodesulfobacteriota bacterium]